MTDPIEEHFPIGSLWQDMSEREAERAPYSLRAININRTIDAAGGRTHVTLFFARGSYELVVPAMDAVAPAWERVG